MTAPELFRALAVVCEGAGAEHQRVATALGLPAGASPADHTDAFVLQLPPYASMYLGAQGMLGGEAADRVAGFWRALGYVPPAGAAAGLGLGLRQGERRFASRAHLSQGPTATLRWLAAGAEDGASRHEHLEASLGAVARFWRSRAETSAALLHQGVGAMAGG